MIALLKFRCDLVRARLRSPPVFANHDVTVIKSLHHRARDPIEADKTKSTKHALRAEVRGEKFFVAETVLQSHQHRALVQERRDKIDNLLVRRCLDRDQHQIARTNFFGRVVAINFRDTKIFISAANGETVLSKFCQIAAHQEMHVEPGMREFPAVIKTDRAGAPTTAMR